MGLTDMGWESVEVFKIHDSEFERPLQQFLDTLEKVKQHLKTETIEDGQVAVHLWLSLQFLHDQKPPHYVMLENDFKSQFVKGVIDLDQVTSRPLMVSINNDSMFNGMDSVTSRLAVELIERMRLQGVLVTSDQRMWRPMYSQFGKQYPILNTTRKGSLGKTAIWSVIEKNLFRQRVFLICATNREHVSVLNKPPLAPSSHLQPLAATCSHLQPLAATCSHLLPAATCSHLQPLAATCSHLQPLAPSSHLQPLAATCSHLQPLAATCSHLLPAATCSHLQPLAPSSHLQPLAATCSHLLSAATCSHRRMLRILRCFPPENVENSPVFSTGEC